MSISNDYYRRAKFLKGAPKLFDCPADVGMEVAFAGRSNAGKSSALNTLTGNKSLSRTSKTPGRTQMINFFELDEHRRLVDLPGYGYAKVPIAVREKWQKHMTHYLKQRKSLQGLIVLMDIRHPLTEADKVMLQWSQFDLPIHVLLTKADKLKRGPAQSTFLKVRSQIVHDYSRVSVSLFSAFKKTGIDDLAEVMDAWFLIKTG